MYKEVLIEFLKFIDDFKDFDYILALIKSTVAPTLKDLKLGTMMNFRNGKRPLKDYWIKNRLFIRESLCLDFFELKEGEDFILVYFFKIENLIKKLSQEKIINYLNSCGYNSCKTVKDYLNFLKIRFINKCPHEIGIFLGYPLKDVIDFQLKDKRFCKCSGYWKCFNNEKSSLEAFKKFDEVKVFEMKNILRNYRTI